MIKDSKENIDRYKEIIKQIHVLATKNEANKVRNESDLDFIIFSALKKPFSTLKEAAAFFMYEIATKHPFFDGNKRTALMTFLIFRYLDLSEDEFAEKIERHFPKSWDDKDNKIVKFMLELASYKRTYEDVVKFVDEAFK